MMKYMIIALLLGGLLLGGAPAAAESAGSTAATALAGFLGLNFLTQAATHSFLDVKVEVYQSELDVAYKDAFKLTMSPALLAQTCNGSGALPTELNLTQLRMKLEPYMAELSAARNRVAETARAWESVGDKYPAAEQVAIDSRALGNRMEAAVAAWQDFCGGLTAAQAVGALDAAALTSLAAKADTLRTAIDNVQHFRMSPERVELIGMSFDLSPDVIKKAAARDTLAGQWAAILFAAKDTVKDEEQLKALDATLKRDGISIDAKSLEAYKSEEQMERAIAVNVTSEIAVRQASAVLAEYSSSVSNVVLGPIKNEAIQVLLTENKVLSRITEPSAQRYWKTLPLARSSAGPGNHNTVVYLENMATPTLKSARYDPNDFIIANAQLTKTLLHALATSAGTLSAAQEEYRPYNLLSIREEVIEAEAAKREAQTSMIQALREVIRANEQDGGDAKATIENAAKLLQQVAK